MPNALIPIYINNHLYQVRATSTVLQACEENGIDVPRFCYHEKLSVAGNCRMCLVEIEKSPKPVASCAMPISKGMVIYTNTPLVKKARESVLEMLLLNHPLDCPICDQAGECDLQDEALNYGSDRGRFFEFKRTVEDKECGPIIKTIMTRCIHCTRCIRFAGEIAGQEVLGAFGRGEHTEIGTYVQSFIKTELSGNLVDLCPVGALTSKPYAFAARNWELQKNDTIDFFDGTTADISVQTRELTENVFENGRVFLQTKDEILRILPRFNSETIDNWITDKTRYALDGLRKQRIKVPLKLEANAHQKQISWKNALFDLGFLIQHDIFPFIKEKNGLKAGCIVEDLCDLETLVCLTFYLKSIGVSNIQDNNFISYANLDAPEFYSLNRTLRSFEQLTALVIIGTNPRYEASILNTFLRKQQLANALPYLYFNNTAPLKIKNTHAGIGTRSLLMFLENKSKATKKYYKNINTSFLIGYDNFRSKNSTSLQNIFQFLSLKFFSQTKEENRASILHSNITSLLFANLGLKPGVRSSFNLQGRIDQNLDMMFILEPYGYKAEKWLSKNKYTSVIGLGTHKVSNTVCTYFLPLKSFYEKNGYLFNIENKLRKFYKVVASPKGVQNLDVLLHTLFQGSLSKPDVLQRVWDLFNDATPGQSQGKSTQTCLNYNILFKEKENNAVVFLAPFYPIIHNFYMTNSISANSSIMGECTLFLNTKTNFNFES